MNRRDHHEVGAFGARLGDPARGVDPARIAIEQQSRHHARIEWRLAKRARVGALDFTQVQALPDQRHDETRQMALRHEVLHARRQKLHLIDLPEAEMLAHGARQNQTRSENATDYSDRLLGQNCTARFSWARPLDWMWRLTSTKYLAAIVSTPAVADPPRDHLTTTRPRSSEKRGDQLSFRPIWLRPE